MEKIEKKKKTIILIAVLLVILIPVLSFVFINNNTNNDVPIGLQIEESIDLSYNEWSIGRNYEYTGVWDLGDGVIKVNDVSNSQIAKATRNFNSIDIGKLKMQMSAPSDVAKNTFRMDFRSGSTILFKLERRFGNAFTLIVLDNVPITIVDLGAGWQTVEIFFNLTDGSSGEVSIDLDGVTVIDAFSFDPNNMEIDNIYMHTSTWAYQSRTDIKFEYLYNFK